MATNHRPLFLFYVVEKIKNRLPLVRYFPEKGGKKKKSEAPLTISSTPLEIDVSLFHEGKIIRGDFLSKPLRNAGSATRQSVRYTLYGG